MEHPKEQRVKAYQMIIYAMKTKDNSMLSVFADGEELGIHLDSNPDLIRDIVWIKPVITNVIAPGEYDE